jgi:hypothetical protein
LTFAQLVSSQTQSPSDIRNWEPTDFVDIFLIQIHLICLLLKRVAIKENQCFVKLKTCALKSTLMSTLNLSFYSIITLRKLSKKLKF